MALLQVLGERADEVEVVPARRGQLVRLDQVVLLGFLHLPSRQHLLDHRQARLLHLKSVHHLELAAQPELGRKQAKHSMKKTIDRAQRQVTHAVQQAAERSAELRRPCTGMTCALG